MERSLLLIPILLTCLTATAISCGGTKSTTRAPRPEIAQEIKTAAAETMKRCPPSPDGIVRCPVDQFRKFGAVCLGCGRALSKERARTEALRSTGALDVEAERHKTNAAETKLASPWRNPWIVIPVTLAIGFGIGWGLGFSQ